MADLDPEIDGLIKSFGACAQEMLKVKPELRPRLLKALGMLFPEPPPANPLGQLTGQLTQFPGPKYGGG